MDVFAYAVVLSILLAFAIDANRLPPEDHHVPGPWKAALANRDILLLTISYFCMNYVFYLFFSWFFFYLVDVKQFGDQQSFFIVLAASYAVRYGPPGGWQAQRL